MLGIMNHVIRHATGADGRVETKFNREYHIRHEELVRRREEEAELYRQLRRRVSL